MESFSFEDTRYLNSFVDWTAWKENKSFFMKSFIEPGNYFDVYRSTHSGLISISEEKKYRMEYSLKDAFGNTTSFSFDITGEKSIVPKEKEEGVLFVCSHDNDYNGLGISLHIPWKSLYTNTVLYPDTTNAYSPFAPRYSLGVKIPLHTYCALTLDIPNDSFPDKEKYGVVSVAGGQTSWLGGKYENGKMTARIRELGQFSVMIDTVPPVVTPVNPAKWTLNQRISFKISDNLSGIESYEGTLDGQFVLFEYDAKTKSLFCPYDDQRMKRGIQTLMLTVTDAAGNRTKIQQTVKL
jgi:hypothetical protein